MIDIDKYSEDLIEKDGIFFSKKKSVISYPINGNDNCLQLEQNSFWFNHRNNCIILGIKRYGKDTILFDIGGGNGYVTKALEDANISSILVEPGIKGCLNAKKRSVSNIICSSLYDAFFISNSLPSIGLFDVLEHIDNDIDFCTQLYNLLIYNGLMFLTVPAYKFLWSKDDIEAGHYRRYSKKEIIAKLRKVGFHIEYATYIFSILPLAILLFRVLPSKLGLIKESTSLDKHKKEHANMKGIFGKVLNIIWKLELKTIRNGLIIPWGGSCFIIARKK